MRFASFCLFFTALVSIGACSNGGDGQTTGSSNSQFGFAGGFVNLDGSGSNSIVTSAPGDGDFSNPSMGCLVAFTGSDATSPSWSKDGDSWTGFTGFSFSDVGDVNGDGISDFATGALNADGASSLSGAVSVYGGGQGSPLELARLSGGDPLDKYGYAVAGGDLNGDGYSDVIVSALYAYGVKFQSGVVYVYFGGANLATTPSVHIAGESGSSSVGKSLSAGDINGDGIDDLIVGTGNKAFIYYGSKDFAGKLNSSQTPDVTVIGTGGGGGHTGSGFGWTTGYLGDINGDGYGEFLVANPRRTDPYTYDNVGTVYLFQGGPNLPSEINSEDESTRITKIVGEGIADKFGSKVAALPDITGDGKPELLVSAIWATGGFDGATMAAGKIYLFNSENLASLHGEEGSATTAQRTFSAGDNGGEFGSSLSANERGEIFVGAPFSDGRRGSAFVFNARTGGYTQLPW